MPAGLRGRVIFGKGNRMDNNELSTNLASLGTDCISRQQAIEAVQNRHMMLSKEKTLLINDLEKLPPAQPEIIRCKDCKHFVREDVEEYTPYGYNTHFHAFCDKHWDREQGEYIDVNLDDFCSFAERRDAAT